MSLDQLSDDAILEILSHLTTARDVANVSRACRALHRTVHQGGGWRSFVRHRFATYAVSEPRDGRWDELAAALTAQSRSWDRKSLLPVAYTHAQSPQSNFFAGQHSRRLHHPFSPALDAARVWNDSFELVVWGAGEDIVGRFRPLASSGSDRRRSNGGGGGGGGGNSGEGDAWFCFEGRRNGYSPAKGDVTAIKLIEPGGKLGMLIGRASGELHLISAERGNASNVVETFRLPEPPSHVKAATWEAAAYVDVCPNQTSIVAGNRATINIFPLRSSSMSEAIPLETFSLDSHTFHGSDDRSLFIHSAKALTNDTIACALGGDPVPLRWLQATPTGLVPKVVDKSDRLLRNLSRSVKTTIRALEVIPTAGLSAGQSGSGNLLLTAWDDGTVRLLDTRTPSPYDMIYRDLFQPEETTSSLLTWGAHHFVAGSNEYPHLKTFDFRWPEHHAEYRYTDALPCSPSPPFPAPPDADWSLPLPHRRPRPDLVHSRCNHAENTVCTFHRLAREDDYHPNACLILQPSSSSNRSSSTSSRRSLPSRIHSLAKSSNAADAFYVGLPGAVAEMRLVAEGESHVGPLVGKAASRRGWQAETAQFAFLETGTGMLPPLEDGYPGLGIYTFSPLLVQQWGGRPWTPPEGARWHRWDRRFWSPDHF
ncbi:hypothetical protein SODALDRAFT_335774 [Sodiomyces alkalinus F11]|uniref:F-box domain-containing protein n=1 Tax=Sodiomyces alkalinus (strain CBS 110278 / VKM F-3762 / F11) TaxID=1314773 RepID=A0A3N2PQC4_SODAK|nr:hypothetical protein SODALDRAFT_335774 [Sodiomyces alkalinus F11]ROT36664.1 hypothetical protein SODALDRAFT_335774 [Sodiomyces alkalinus F11]